LELPWGMSCVHFSHTHDAATIATAKHFSHRRIPVLFVMCQPGPLPEGGHALRGKVYRLEEIHIKEAEGT